MNFNKYKNLLFKKIKDQISDWFEDRGDKLIPNSEVYLFLHSIKGTAGTLQMGGIFQIASHLMDQLTEPNDNQWQREELWDFLYELISHTYEYENFEEEEKTKEQPKRDNVPLIQIIDDDVSMLILLKDALEEKGWMVITNTKAEKAVSQYFDLHPDCVIIDVNLPNKNGFEVIEDLQKHNNRQFVPKMMMSILNDRETRINAYRKGADDFIQKPVDLEELIVRLERHLKRKQIYDQSVLLDELTKLYNRQFLKTVFERNINDLKRLTKIFTIAVLDIDHFKTINDTYGHLAGDKVLFSFAAFLKESTRSTDSVFRYGGEEFIILFEHTENQHAVEIVTRLLNDFSNKTFVEDGQSFNVTFSAGVYSVDRPDITLDTAFKAADQALYKAKENGRERVESANSSMPRILKRPLYVSIIDDDAIIRTMLLRILQSMDLRHYELDIMVYEDGRKFFDSNRFEQEGEHFLILDGVMPVMDGVEVLQKVKKSPNGKNALVLMLTGRKSEYDIARALKLGADDYVTKPFSITELQARIERLIQRKS